MNLRIHYRPNAKKYQSCYRVKSYGKFYHGDDLPIGLSQVGHPGMTEMINVVLKDLRKAEPNKSVYSVNIETT